MKRRVVVEMKDAKNGWWEVYTEPEHGLLQNTDVVVWAAGIVDKANANLSAGELPKELVGVIEDTQVDDTDDGDFDDIDEEDEVH